MKIVFATPHFPPEQSESAKYVYTLAKKLAREHSVTVITYANKTDTIENVRLKNISKDKHPFVRFFQYTRAIYTSAHGADVIYIQRGGASGLPALIAGKLTKTPVVVHYTEDEAWEKLHTSTYPSLHQGQFRKNQKIPGAVWGIWHAQHIVLQKADGVIAPSKYVADELIRTHGLLTKKVQCVYSPLQEDISLPASVTRVIRKMFLDTPLLTWKDVATAIRTVALLKDTFPDITLFIAGEGPEKASLQELTEEKGVTKNVTFLGNIPEAEKKHQLKNAQVFLSTAMYEEKPDILFPAMNACVPILATDIPGQRECLVHKENALLLPPGNARAGATLLTELFSDRALEKKLTQNAYQLLKKEFSWESHTEKLTIIFKTQVKNTTNHNE